MINGMIKRQRRALLFTKYIYSIEARSLNLLPKEIIARSSVPLCRLVHIDYFILFISSRLLFRSVCPRKSRTYPRLSQAGVVD
jgi:hypothetical protein